MSFGEKMLIYQWLLCVLLVSVVLSNGVKVRDCEPLKIEICRSIGYNGTSMPNLVGHTNQGDADFQLATFRPLIEYSCSEHLKFFLCAAYAPMCSEKILEPLGPCRPMCEHVKSRCEPTLNEFGYPWPAHLNCSKFPQRVDDTTMCMMPDGFETPNTQLSTPKAPQVPANNGNISPGIGITNIIVGSSGCSHLRNGPKKYIYINNTSPPKCLLLCNENDLFSKQDKDFAETFLAIFSTVCVILTGFTVLTFAIDPKRFGYPERPIVLMAFCYLCCALTNLVRLSTDRKSTICHTDHEANQEVLLTDGLESSSCTIIFLLLYYFTTSIHIWWLILALNWFLCAGMKWSYEALAEHSNCYHLAAWAIPAGTTILALLLRYVDPDELTALCYVGNRNPDNLMIFVIAPLCLYILLGIIFFIAGFVGLFRLRTHVHNKGGKTSRLERLMVKICMFSLVFVLADICVVSCYIYQYVNLYFWLSADYEKTPDVEIFMLKIVCSLLGGLATGIWVWNEKTIATWKAFFPRLCCCFKTSSKPTEVCSTSTHSNSVLNSRCSYASPQQQNLLRQSPVTINSQQSHSHQSSNWKVSGQMAYRDQQPRGNHWAARGYSRVLKSSPDAGAL